MNSYDVLGKFIFLTYTQQYNNMCFAKSYIYIYNTRVIYTIHNK